MSNNPSIDLKDLHAQLAEVLAVKLQEQDITPAYLNVVRQFLKDNHIEDLPKAGTPFGDLADIDVTEDDCKIIPMIEATG